MSCTFCEYLFELQAAARRKEDSNPKLHHDYHALILSRAWNDYTGTAHAGTMTHKPKVVGFELNYCPECGKELET